MKNIDKYLPYACGLLLLVACCNNNANKETYQFYINKGTKEIKKDNFEDMDNIYPYNLWGNVVVNDVKVASNIAYIILKEHFGKEYFNANTEFQIYSVNNMVWAIFEKKSNILLLLIQKKNCKVIYIHKP